MLSFERDQKSTSKKHEKIILMIQKLEVKSFLTSTSLMQDSHELVLVKNNIVEVLVTNVFKVNYITIERSFEFITTIIKIRKIYNKMLRKFKLMNKLIAIRIELKIEYYDKNVLIAKLKSRIRSLSFIYFIDDFDLYRNMYRSLTKIYLTSISLNLYNR